MASCLLECSLCFLSSLLFNPAVHLQQFSQTMRHPQRQPSLLFWVKAARECPAVRKPRQPLIVKIIIWLPRWLFPVCLKGGTLFTSSSRLAKDGVLPAFFFCSNPALINFRCFSRTGEQRMWKSTLSHVLMILGFSVLRYALWWGLFEVWKQFKKLVGMILSCRHVAAASYCHHSERLGGSIKGSFRKSLSPSWKLCAGWMFRTFSSFPCCWQHVCR